MLNAEFVNFKQTICIQLQHSLHYNMHPKPLFPVFALCTFVLFLQIWSSIVCCGMVSKKCFFQLGSTFFSAVPYLASIQQLLIACNGLVIDHSANEGNFSWVDLKQAEMTRGYIPHMLLAFTGVNRGTRREKELFKRIAMRLLRHRFGYSSYLSLKVYSCRSLDWG